MKKSIILSCCLLIIQLLVFSQPQVENVRIVITPDHENWIYRTGEEAIFNVTVFQYNIPVKDVPVTVEIMPEKMDPVKTEQLVLRDGKATIDAGTMDQPGFLRCMVKTEMNGHKYSDFTTVAYDPLNIQPTTTLPDDFSEFWDQAKSELEKVPVDPVLTLMPERCTPGLDVYHVRIRNISGHIYGILAVPKAPGKYPAILNVPGAGVRSYYGDTFRAEKGIITLQIGIHGVPVTMDRYIYDDLASATINGYWTVNMDDRDKYYYKRVYLGCVRAVDFIFSLEEFDGKNIAVEGGSQGGALSIITAGLDHRISYLGAFYPALCDLTGYLHGRAGGWPHMFIDEFTNKPEKIETSRYYDVVNFARFVKAKGMYSWGFNDDVCPPTSMYSAYNLITAPKELKVFYDTRHWTYPEQREMMNEWLYDMLLKKD